MAEITQCAVPLLEADLPQYDVVPDGVLYLNEFGGPKLDCFVSRYVHTDDQAIRRVFLGALKNSLWEAMRKLLADYPKQDPKLDERVDLIKRIEFPQKQWNVSADVESNDSIDNETTEENGSRYRLDKDVIASAVSGSFSIRQPVLQDWRVLFGFNLAGLHNRETQDTGDSKKEYSYYGHKLGGSAGFRSADDSRMLYLSGSWDQRYRPAPDQLQRSLSGDGGIKLRSKHYSIGGSANYATTQNEAPPASSGYLTTQNESLTGQAEATAQRATLGAVLVYSYSNTDVTDHYSHDLSNNQSSSLLAQYTRDTTLLRAGMGGGWSDGEFTAFNDPTRIHYDAANVRWSLLAKHSLTETLTTSGSANLRMNRSNGTFVGWYPSWDANLAVDYSGKKLALAFSLLYEGSHINLNHERDKVNLQATAAATYRPWKSVKIKLSGKARDLDVTGYKASGSRSVSVSTNVGYTPNDHLWVGGYGSYYLGDYHFTGGKGDFGGYSFGTGLSIYY